MRKGARRQMEQEVYWLWLAACRGLGSRGIEHLLAQLGSPEEIYRSPAGAYRGVKGLSRAALHALEDKSLDGVRRTLEQCGRENIRLIALDSPRYPQRLRAISSPPVVLYCRGSLPDTDREASVAVIGARRCSPYGESMARLLAGDLARAGCVVVSGLAYGIDTAGIEAALSEGGQVLAVLGCGVDVVYPRQNRELYERVARQGALVSEYPPGTRPMAAYFPARNRIISGMSAGVALVEGRAGGGGMITVNLALEQGREVFAVPGPADCELSDAPNRLIREGSAKLVLSAGDILEELPPMLCEGLRPIEPRAAHAPSRQPEEAPEGPARAQGGQRAVDNGTGKAYIDWRSQKSRLTDYQTAILEMLEQGPKLADDLVDALELPVRQVLSALTVLQIEGFVQDEGAGMYGVRRRA